ncbi:YdeI/OmpD-associated family protein [Geodermatophilus sp. SYSU D00815]
MTTPSDLPVHRFADQETFEKWLEAEHERSPGAYVVIAKKGAPEPTLTQQELVESLLCFGWIDGRANRLDDHHYTIRVTPRRAKSLWSKKNVDWVGRLIEAGRMRPAGLAAVEAAQADGRWDRAYAGPATITVPDDLAAALAAEPRAEQFFAGLDGANRYAVLWRVHTATTPATRAKRIAALVEMLAGGRTIH